MHKRYIFILLLAAVNVSVMGQTTNTDTIPVPPPNNGKQVPPPPKQNDPITPDPKTTDPTSQGSDGSGSSLSPALNLNFAGSKNPWAVINPIVSYAYTMRLINGGGNWAIPQWDFQFGPYLASPLSLKDSTSYLPALMLPGTGVQLNNYFTFTFNKTRLILCPFNFGLKIISGFTDSSITLVQDNWRPSLAVNINDNAQFSFQYSDAWHNSSTGSEDNFKKIFNTTETHIRYITVSLQGKIANLTGDSKKPLYFVLNWQNFLTKGLNLPNSKIWSFGIISAIDFRSGSNPGALPKSPMQ